MKTDHFDGLFPLQVIDFKGVTSVTLDKQMVRDTLSVKKHNKNNDIKSLSRLSPVSPSKNINTCKQLYAVSADTQKGCFRDKNPQTGNNRISEQPIVVQNVKPVSKNEKPNDYGMVTCWQCNHWMKTWCNNSDVSSGAVMGKDPEKWRRCTGYS